MSTSPSFGVHFAAGLEAQEVKTSVLGWGSYLIIIICYCSVYQLVVSASPPDVAESVGWALRDWGIWLVATPLIFSALRRYEAAGRPLSDYVELASLILIVTLTLRIFINYWTEERSLLVGFLVILPKYLLALIAVAWTWHLILRKKPKADVEPAPVITPVLPVAQTLLVSKGKDECLIPVMGVHCVSAAGNYVEIFADQESYLLRATLKQVEDLLPPAQFIRIHRSHIVNIHAIDRIQAQPSGNGLIKLRCGRVVSMSKRYKNQVYRYRPQAV